MLFRKAPTSTVFPGNSELSFIEVQRRSSVTLFPVIEARTLLALQAPLALPEPRRHGAALTRLVHDHREALAHLREGDGRGPLFSPARLLAPATTEPVPPAFAEVATPSKGGPHRQPHPLRSCFLGDMLPYDARLWPPGHPPQGGAQLPQWTGHQPPSPPRAGRGHESAAPPPSPRRLAGVGGCGTPRAVEAPQPPGALGCHRARQGAARPPHPGLGSRMRPGATAPWQAAPGPSTPGARLREPAAPCATLPPTENALPQPQGGAATRREVPSRRPLTPSQAPARPHGAPASPRPMGDAGGRLSKRWAPRLGPGVPGPASMLWASKAGWPPGWGPVGRRSPRKGPRGSSQRGPDGHTTAWPRPPTRAGRGKARGVAPPHTPSPGSRCLLTCERNASRQQVSSHAAQPRKACRGRRD
jgi:hypothetical protein